MHVAYQLLSERPAKAAVWAFVQLGTLSFNAPSSLVGRALPWKMDVFLHHCVHRVLQDRALWLYLSHVDDERFTQKKSLVLQFIKEGRREGEEQLPQKQRQPGGCSLWCCCVCSVTPGWGLRAPRAARAEQLCHLSSCSVAGPALTPSSPAALCGVLGTLGCRPTVYSSPSAPHCWGLGQRRGHVCACSVCWNVWSLWHTLPWIGAADTQASRGVGPHTADFFYKWLKDWERVSPRWRFFPKCSCIHPLQREKHRFHFLVNYWRLEKRSVALLIIWLLIQLAFPSLPLWLTAMPPARPLTLFAGTPEKKGNQEL